MQKQHKMYVVVRDDLAPAQKAVQAGHALAEWMLGNDSWRNQTLVYLKARNKVHLTNIVAKLSRSEVQHVKFHEPDIGDEITAIASLGTNHVFEKLPLLR